METTLAVSHSGGWSQQGREGIRSPSLRRQGDNSSQQASSAALQQDSSHSHLASQQETTANMVSFLSIATALLGVASLTAACKQVDCCYSANGGCPDDVYDDCWSKCCGTTKVWEMRKQRNNAWQNVYVYPGVACAD